ncbi:MAG: CBS domain-containing protein [Deltaproteobacteria bacterium]|nr:MAG: CBS domain-containing protein [Deltaproteobacteria bacterium]TNF24916.1 MAG: CBS domain-containing protein [Deltaproteobacteria bacterium]
MDLEFTITSKKEFLSLKLSQLHSKDVLSVAVATPVEEIISMLHEHNVGAVMVMEGSGLRGVVSERDIINKLADPTQKLSKLCAQDVMTSKPITLSINDTFDTAMRTMNEKRFRHLPVVDDNGVVVSVFSIKEALDFLLMHL